MEEVEQLIKSAQLSIPEGEVQQFGGKKGYHTEHLGYLLADFQYMQRAYPNMKW